MLLNNSEHEKDSVDHSTDKEKQLGGSWKQPLHLDDAKKKRRTRIVYGVVAGCIVFLILMVIISNGGGSSGPDVDPHDGGGGHDLPDHMFTAQKMIDLLKGQPNLDRYQHNDTNLAFIENAWKATMFGNSIFYFAKTQGSSK